MSFHFFLFACVTVGFFVSCQKPLDDRLFYEGDRLVVHGVLTADEPFSLELSRSYPATGFLDSNYFVSGAQVQLFQGDSLLFALVHRGRGIYAASPGWRPQVGIAYHVEAEATGFPSIQTKAVSVPPAPSVENFRFQDSVFTPGSTDASGGVATFDLRQRSDQDDFYRFTAALMWDSLTQFTDLAAQDALITDATCGHGNAFFNDACLLTQPFPFEFRLAIKSERINRTWVRPNQLIIYASQISESYYRYYQNLSQPEDFEQAFTEPRPTYSNITGGYGFLGAQHKIAFAVRL